MGTLALLLVFIALICTLLRAFNAPVKPDLGWFGVALIIITYLLQHFPR